MGTSEILDDLIWNDPASKNDVLWKEVTPSEAKRKSERNNRKSNFINEKGKESIEGKNEREAKSLILTIEKIANSIKRLLWKIPENQYLTIYINSPLPSTSSQP